MRAVLELSRSDVLPDKGVGGFSRDELETVHIARVPINFRLRMYYRYEHSVRQRYLATHATYK